MRGWRLPEGREVLLAEYLEKVWEVVGRAALNQVLGGAGSGARNGAAGVLEEDARLTALFLWTLQSSNGVKAEENGEDEDDSENDEEKEAPKKKTGGYALVFDVARRFAQPLGIHLPDWEGRIIATEKGVIRLLPLSERAKQLFGEEGTQYVATQLEKSPAAAAQLTLFPDGEGGAGVNVKGRGRKPRKATTGGAELAAERKRDADHARPRSRGDASPASGTYPSAPQLAAGRAGTRARFPTPRQCALSSLPAR